MLGRFLSLLLVVWYPRLELWLRLPDRVILQTVKGHTHRSRSSVECFLGISESFHQKEVTSRRVVTKESGMKSGTVQAASR